MLPNDPPYFSCVMKSSNYAVSPLVAVFSLSWAGRVMFSCTQHKPCCADTRSCCTLCYHDYISATRASTCTTYSQGRKVEAPWSIFICYCYMGECSTHNLPWACFHCTNTRFSGQGQAAAFSDMTKQQAV